MSDDYDSYYDYDDDGKLDDYETFMKEDDDDYFYHKTYGNSINISSSYHATKGNGGGLSIGKSILYGFIIYVAFFALIGVNPGDGGEYLPLIIWGIISVVLYFGTNGR